jgi:hypothetical protein
MRGRTGGKGAILRTGDDDGHGSRVCVGEDVDSRTVSVCNTDKQTVANNISGVPSLSLLRGSALRR